MSTSLALAERNVPRYTSYPTAPHFSSVVGPELYGEWLAALPPKASLSVYIHVPFCTDLCFYCGCNTRAVRKREPIDAYAERLIEEVALLEGLSGRKLTHLHWGGGTPSILGPAWLETIAATLASRFDLSGLKEHAIELDPRRLDKPLVRTLKAIGINRASLGMQDANPHVQQAIGRVQPFELVERAASWLREAGIENLNLDLMYGLPGQTARDAAHSAELAVSLEPQRLALFGYAHVPWFKTHQRLIDDATLPGPSERLEQAQASAETLISFGYQTVGLDHFALPGDELCIAARSQRLHRNFQGYTTDDADALIGLGASAIGRLPQGFVQNAPDLGGYSRAVGAGRLATAKGLALSDEDRIRSAIIERLMCDLGVDLDCAAGGSARFAAEIDALRVLAGDGLLKIDGARITVTEQGRPYVRIAAAAFDTYLAASQKRHSVAV
ncbi:MAG: oxygen-independent coproporphyrinogen III oxidase [Deltaproteobacteria bacterium]|nr:oxygen-independent coproporphyrinogen III oxidase [Deltaproteobacteria bacterium]